MIILDITSIVSIYKVQYIIMGIQLGNVLMSTTLLPADDNADCRIWIFVCPTTCWPFVLSPNTIHDQVLIGFVVPLINMTETLVFRSFVLSGVWTGTTAECMVTLANAGQYYYYSALDEDNRDAMYNIQR